MRQHPGNLQEENEIVWTDCASRLASVVQRQPQIEIRVARHTIGAIRSLSNERAIERNKRADCSRVYERWNLMPCECCVALSFRPQMSFCSCTFGFFYVSHREIDGVFRGTGLGPLSFNFYVKSVQQWIAPDWVHFICSSVATQGLMCVKFAGKKAWGNRCFLTLF